MATSTASAAFTSPRLYASQPEQANRVHLLYTASTAEDATGRVTLHVPVAYQTRVDPNRPTLVGSATLRGDALDRNRSNFVLAGIVERRPANGTYLLDGQRVPLTTAATQCTGKADHTAYWVLVLRGSGQTLELPAFVDRLSAPSVFGSDATITVCLRAPDVPAGTPGRAPLGLKVRELDLRVTQAFTSPKRGQQVWRAVVTPFRPGTAELNAPATVEVQSVLTYPRSIGLKKPVLVRTTPTSVTYKFDGEISLGERGQPTIRLYRGFNKTQVGAASASSELVKRGVGPFTKLVTIRRTERAQQFFFQARATMPNVVQGQAGCNATFKAENVPCIQATRAGFLIRSTSWRIVVPKR